jgi:hypothetical protein
MLQMKSINDQCARNAPEHMETMVTRVVTRVLDEREVAADNVTRHGLRELINEALQERMLIILTIVVFVFFITIVVLVFFISFLDFVFVPVFSLLLFSRLSFSLFLAFLSSFFRSFFILSLSVVFLVLCSLSFVSFFCLSLSLAVTLLSLSLFDFLSLSPTNSCCLCATMSILSHALRSGW